MYKIALCIGLLNLSFFCHGVEGGAAELFKRHGDNIYQIRLVDLASHEKSALGSGFLVSAQGVLATNYHVIEFAISQPGKYRIEYLGADGRKGDLVLLDVDVVHDLALLKSAALVGQPFELLQQEPQRGETIYSLGNPHDIGFTVVPGTYNGIDERSYYRRIHFSGSINAGMSGGPVLDAMGRVVGINVSSAGNQISFLVPVSELQNLVLEWRQRGGPVADFKQRISMQLHANQERLITSMLGRTWNTQPLGEATAVGEMQPFVKCWGESSDDKLRYKQVSSTCQGDEYIYLSHTFTTGNINYQFFWMDADKLNRWQFYNLYENLFDSFMPDNRAGKNDVSDFICDEQFVEGAKGDEKAVLCTRAYRDFPGLFDVVYLGGSIHNNKQAFVRHFTLAGVTRASAQAFLKRFMATALWQ